MTEWRHTPARARRGLRTAGAFVRMGALEDAGYPLAVTMTTVGLLVPAAVQFFLAKIVEDTDRVGGDYYTFAILGIFASQFLSVGLRSFSLEVGKTIDQGRLEFLLVQPIRWRLLPFLMVQWMAVREVLTLMVLLVVATALGAQFQWSAAPAALLVLSLGFTAVFAIGMVAATVRMLAKRVDPILRVYDFGVQIFAGVLYPVALIPGGIRWISWLLPHTYVLAAIRRLVMVNGDQLSGPSLVTTVVALIVAAVVLMSLALWILSRAFAFGRRTGLLAGY